MSRSSSSSSSVAAAGVSRSPESAWRRSELLPLLVSQVPPHPLSVNFDRHAKKGHAKHEGAGHALGDTIPLDKLSHEPQLDWTLDAAEPEALWTVDVDDPDRRLASGEHPDYRKVTVAHASTPPVQKVVWLLVNVPSPQMIKNGHIVAEWEVDVEELQKKQELHRLAFFVFKQKGRVLANTAVEHSMDSKSARQASLAHFIHKHPQIGAQHAFAGAFFWIDAQSDEAYARSKHVSEMLQPIESMPKLPHAVKHPHPQTHAAPPPASPSLSALSLGEEHGPRGAAPPKEEQKQRAREEKRGLEDPEEPIAGGAVKQHAQQP